MHLHGTADDNVPCIPHTKALVSALQELNKEVVVRYFEDGRHDLTPLTDRFSAFQSMLTKGILSHEKEYPDDFLLKSIIKIACGEKVLCRNLFWDQCSWRSIQ